jgi:hypothetical protein
MQQKRALDPLPAPSNRSEAAEATIARAESLAALA